MLIIPHRVFPWNPKNILESSDNDDDEETTKKATNLSKPTLSQKNKTNNKPAPKLNRQPSVEDSDEVPVEVVEQPVESAEAELS